MRRELLRRGSCPARAGSRPCSRRCRRCPRAGSRRVRVRGTGRSRGRGPAAFIPRLRSTPSTAACSRASATRRSARARIDCETPVRALLHDRVHVRHAPERLAQVLQLAVASPSGLPWAATGTASPAWARTGSPRDGCGRRGRAAADREHALADLLGEGRRSPPRPRAPPRAGRPCSRASGSGCRSRRSRWPCRGSPSFVNCLFRIVAHAVGAALRGQGQPLHARCRRA